MIAVMAAMEDEVKGLREAMIITKSHREGGCRFHEGVCLGQGLLLAVTGIGRRRAGEGVEVVVTRFQPGAIISTGYAGALDSSLRAGDIFIYSTVCGISGELPRAETGILPALASHLGLVSLASNVLTENGIPYAQGTGITATRVVPDLEAKGWLGRVSGARAVDMESYWVAQAAVERGIPFLAARAISDTLGQDLSPLLGLVNSDGTLNKGQASLHFLSRPWQVPGAVAYLGNARRARHSLKLFLKSLVAGINDLEPAG